MFARIVKSNLKPNHTADFNEAIEKQILPLLRKAKGFQDQITFAGPSGTEMVSAVKVPKLGCSFGEKRWRTRLGSKFTVGSNSLRATRATARAWSTRAKAALRS